MPGENELEIIIRAQNLFSAELQRLLADLQKLVPTSDAVNQKFSQLYTSLGRLSQQQQRTAAGFTDLGGALSGGVGTAVEGFQQLQAAAIQAERLVSYAVARSEAAEQSLRKSLDSTKGAETPEEPEAPTWVTQQAAAGVEQQLQQVEDAKEAASNAGDILTAAWASRNRAVQQGLATEVKEWDKLLPSITAATQAKAAEAAITAEQARTAGEVVGQQAKYEANIAQTRTQRFAELHAIIRSGTGDLSRYNDLMAQMPQHLNSSAQAAWVLGQRNAELKKFNEATQRSVEEVTKAYQQNEQIAAQTRGETGKQMALPGISRFVPGQEGQQLTLPGINRNQLAQTAALAEGLRKLGEEGVQASGKNGLGALSDTLFLMLPRITSLMPGLNAFTTLILQIQNVKNLGNMLTAALGGGGGGGGGGTGGGGAAGAAANTAAAAVNLGSALGGIAKIAAPAAIGLGYLVVAMRQLSAREEMSVQSTAALNSAIAALNSGSIQQYGAEAAHQLDVINERLSRGITSFSWWRQAAETAFTALTEFTTPAGIEFDKLAKSAAAYEQILPKIIARQESMAKERLANLEAQEARFGLYSARSVEHLIILQEQLTGAYKRANEARKEQIEAERSRQQDVLKQQMGVEHLLGRESELIGLRQRAIADPAGSGNLFGGRQQAELGRIQATLGTYRKEEARINTEAARQAEISNYEQRVATERRMRQFMSMQKRLEAEPTQIRMEISKLSMQTMQGQIQLLQAQLAEAADAAVSGILGQIRSQVAASGQIQIDIAQKTGKIKLAQLIEPPTEEQLREWYEPEKGGVSEGQWKHILDRNKRERAAYNEIKTLTQDLVRAEEDAARKRVDVETKLNAIRERDTLGATAGKSLQEVAKLSAAEQAILAIEEQIARQRLQQDITPENWRRYADAVEEAARRSHEAALQTIRDETAVAVNNAKGPDDKVRALNEGQRKTDDLQKRREKQLDDDTQNIRQVGTQQTQSILQAQLEQTQAMQQGASARAQLLRAQMQGAGPGNWEAILKGIQEADEADRQYSLEAIGRRFDIGIAAANEAKTEEQQSYLRGEAVRKFTLEYNTLADQRRLKDQQSIQEIINWRKQFEIEMPSQLFRIDIDRAAINNSIMQVRMSMEQLKLGSIDLLPASAQEAAVRGTYNVISQMQDLYRAGERKIAADRQADEQANLLKLADINERYNPALSDNLRQQAAKLREKYLSEDALRTQQYLMEDSQRHQEYLNRLRQIYESTPLFQGITRQLEQFQSDVETVLGDIMTGEFKSWADEWNKIWKAMARNAAKYLTDELFTPVKDLWKKTTDEVVKSGQPVGESGLGMLWRGIKKMFGMEEAAPSATPGSAAANKALDELAQSGAGTAGALGTATQALAGTTAAMMTVTASVVNVYGGMGGAGGPGGVGSKVLDELAQSGAGTPGVLADASKATSAALDELAQSGAGTAGAAIEISQDSLKAFDDALVSMGGSMDASLGTMTSNLGSSFDGVVKGFGGVMEGAGSRFTGLFQALGAGITSLIAALGANSATNTASGAMSMAGGAAGAASAAAAEGGIFRGPTTAVIGEDGPEVVLPLTKPKRMAQLLHQVKTLKLAQGGIIGAEDEERTPDTVVWGNITYKRTPQGGWAPEGQVWPEGKTPKEPHDFGENLRDVIGWGDMGNVQGYATTMGPIGKIVGGDDITRGRGGLLSGVTPWNIFKEKVFAEGGIVLPQRFANGGIVVPPRFAVPRLAEGGIVDSNEEEQEPVDWGGTELVETPEGGFAPEGQGAWGTSEGSERQSSGGGSAMGRALSGGLAFGSPFGLFAEGGIVLPYGISRMPRFAEGAIATTPRFVVWGGTIYQGTPQGGWTPVGKVGAKAAPQITLAGQDQPGGDTGRGGPQGPGPGGWGTMSPDAARAAMGIGAFGGMYGMAGALGMVGTSYGVSMTVGPGFTADPMATTPSAADIQSAMDVQGAFAAQALAEQQASMMNRTPEEGGSMQMGATQSPAAPSVGAMPSQSPMDQTQPGQVSFGTISMSGLGTMGPGVAGQTSQSLAGVGLAPGDVQTGVSTQSQTSPQAAAQAAAAAMGAAAAADAAQAEADAAAAASAAAAGAAAAQAEADAQASAADAAAAADAADAAGAADTAGAADAAGTEGGAAGGEAGGEAGGTDSGGGTGGGTGGGEGGGGGGDGGGGGGADSGGADSGGAGSDTSSGESGNAWARGGVSRVSRKTRAVYGEKGTETAIFVPEAFEQAGRQGAEEERVIETMVRVLAKLSGKKVEDFAVKMAEGGLVSRPTLAVVGEKGPEAVVPLPKMPTIPRPQRSETPGGANNEVTVVNVFREKDMEALMASAVARGSRVVVNDIIQGMAGNRAIRRTIQRTS